MSTTSMNTHRRAMRPVTPAVRAGRVAAGAAMAAGIVFGGATAATADPQAENPAPRADGSAATEITPAVAPAVTIPAVGGEEEGEDAAPAASLAPSAGSISVAIPEPEPVVEETEEETEVEETSSTGSADATEGTETREDDASSSRDTERESTEDSSSSEESSSSEGGSSEESSSSSEESSSSSSSAGKGSSILATAQSGIGTPYVYGGTSTSGWDCSGFVQWVYAQHGISLPRGAADQAAAGRVIPRSEARPGDIVYKPGHIGIYAGGNEFVDAGNSRVDTSQRNIYSGSWTFIRVG